MRKKGFSTKTRSIYNKVPDFSKYRELYYMFLLQLFTQSVMGDMLNNIYRRKISIMKTKMTGVEIKPRAYDNRASPGSNLRKMMIGSHINSSSLTGMSRHLGLEEDYLRAALSVGDPTEISDRLAISLERYLRVAKHAFSLPVLIKKNPKHYYSLALYEKMMRLKEGDPESICYKDVEFTFGALSGQADLAITQDDGSLKTIGLQRDPKDIEYSYQELKGLMLMSGSQYGLIYDPAQSTSIGDHWFMQLDGELIETNNPEFAPHKLDKASDLMVHMRTHH